MFSIFTVVFLDNYFYNLIDFLFLILKHFFHCNGQFGSITWVILKLYFQCFFRLLLLLIESMVKPIPFTHSPFYHFSYTVLSIFTNPSTRAGYDTRSIFKWSLTGLNSEFSFSLTSWFTKAEELSLSYYLPIAGGRIIGFIPFPRVLVLCEMQSVSSKNWTCVAVSISYDDNHNNTGTLHCHISL